MSAENERDEVTGRNKHQQECVDKYHSRIVFAICGPESASHVWDKPAAMLRYCWQEATGEGHELGYGSLTEQGKKVWRDTAFAFAEHIAEQLGDTVVDARREDFQDDERVLLDLGPVPGNIQPDPPAEQIDGRLQYKLIMGNAFIQSLADAGIIGNPKCTESVTVFAKAWEDVVITQKLYGDERMLDQVGNAPSDDEIQAYLNKNPRALNGALKQYLRIHGLTGVRRQ